MCMSQSPLAEELLSKAQQLNKRIEAFKTAHANYHSMLSDEDEIQHSQDYHESECARIANFQETLHQFITRQVQRITRVKFDWKIRLAMSVQENKRDRSHHLGNQVVAPWLMSLAQDWSLLQKGQLYKQMAQPYINSKLYSKKNHVSDRKLLGSNNFKKKPSFASIKERVS